MTTTTNTPARVRIAELNQQWTDRKIDKYEFYGLTGHYSAQVVSEVTGISVDVIRDRRRYLNILRKDSENNVATEAARHGLLLKRSDVRKDGAPGFGLYLLVTTDDRAARKAAFARGEGKTLTEIAAQLGGRIGFDHFIRNEVSA